jgi:hypothetical protein
LAEVHLRYASESACVHVDCEGQLLNPDVEPPLVLEPPLVPLVVELHATSGANTKSPMPRVLASLVKSFIRVSPP